jgi:hypothetical protein
MDKEFVKKAYELYLEWEKVYRMEAKECDYQALDWVYCPKEGREDEKKYRRDIHAALQGQIEFIKHHVALMAIEPSERGTLRYIGRFLSMQHLIGRNVPRKPRHSRRGQGAQYERNFLSGKPHPVGGELHKYFPDGKEPPITITFWGGSPVCARIYVEELCDIDFEDSYAYLYFQIISISNNSYKTWTRNRIKEVIQHIKEDMEFDGDKVDIELEFDWGINSPGSHEISLCCEVKEFGEE